MHRISRILFVSMIVLLACAPARVRVPRERLPDKPQADKLRAEKSPTQKVLPERPSLDEGLSIDGSRAEIPEVKSYGETVPQWRTYQDLARWMAKDFSFDTERYKKYEGTLPVPRTPEETFRLKSGIYIDAALFVKETLNRVDSSLKPQILVLMVRPYRYNHYVCSFQKGGRIFVMDYGTPYKLMTGVQGPFRSLKDYQKFYELNHPEKRKVEAINPLP